MPLHPDEDDFAGEWTVDATMKADPAYLVSRFTLRSVEGPEPANFESSTDRCAIGSHPSNDLVLQDPTVSRFHAEVVIEAGGPRVRDLGSRNGTRIDGVRVGEGWLRNGSLLRTGRSVLRFDLGQKRNKLQVSPREEFGTMVGPSVAMRTVFAQLEKAAPTDVTVLLEGETGTGKEEAAASIHQASRRTHGPLVVIDCGAIPPNLLESELFGHEAGAFTGAHKRRVGAFEEAHGGTLFLDEIGELPLEMQPSLLRVLERREVRRLGSNEFVPVDIRVVAATNRDLRREVSAGRFREDLYYRLAVVRIVLPPLRSRPEDLRALVERILEGRALAPEVLARLTSPEFMAALRKGAWPGNVRELRNYLERSAIFDQPAPPAAEDLAHMAQLVDPTVPYQESRRRVLEEFERSYAEALLEYHRGNVSKAAREAGMGRTYLHRLLRRHGVERS
ncbi:MAG: sigma 54-interacting transcriptional regulator [Myxococcota bacterium]